MSLKFAATVVLLVPVVLVLAWPAMIACTFSPRLAHAICEPVDAAVA